MGKCLYCKRFIKGEHDVCETCDEGMLELVNKDFHKR